MISRITPETSWIAAVAAPWKLNPLLITARSNAPHSTPESLPFPPVRATPPMMAAVTACSRKLRLVPGCPAASDNACMEPAIPANTPLMMKHR